MSAYPYQVNDFDFVKYWTDAQKLEAAKILNRNLKYWAWAKSDLLNDLWHDCVLYLLERNGVAIGKVGRRSKNDVSEMRDIAPCDLITFLNKVVKPKYYNNRQGIDSIDEYEDHSQQNTLECNMFEEIMLSRSIQNLLADEKDFIQFVFLNEGTCVEYSRELKVSKVAVSKKQKKILNKLRYTIGA